MTNLPHNPTKTDLMEQHWYSFLQLLKQAPENPEAHNLVDLASKRGLDYAFWDFVMDHYIQSPAPVNKDEDK